MVDVYKSLLLPVFLVFFLIACDFCFAADAMVTEIYVSPAAAVVPEVSESLGVNISVMEVTDLYGWQFTLYYNNTLLNCTGVSEGPFLMSGGETIMWEANIENNYNFTHGRLRASCSLRTGPGGTGVNGSGVLATMNFTAKVEGGPCVLDLCDTMLVDSHENLIPHQAVDGTVTVIPEFPSMVYVFFLMVVVFVVAVFKKLNFAREIFLPKDRPT